MMLDVKRRTELVAEDQWALFRVGREPEEASKRTANSPNEKWWSRVSQWKVDANNENKVEAVARSE